VYLLVLSLEAQYLHRAKKRRNSRVKEWFRLHEKTPQKRGLFTHGFGFVPCCVRQCENSKRLQGRQVAEP